MEDEGWPPESGGYFPRRILLRLDALEELTQVRSAFWTDDTAKVTIWPYGDDIMAAVRDRLAPLDATVEPQQWLPRRY